MKAKIRSSGKVAFVGTGLNLCFPKFITGPLVLKQKKYNKQKIAINYMQAILILTKDGGKNAFLSKFQKLTSFEWPIPEF